jgi:hypothetical protein
VNEYEHHLEFPVEMEMLDTGEFFDPQLNQGLFNFLLKALSLESDLDERFKVPAI